MLDNKVSKSVFHWTSVLTTWFPRAGATFFDRAIIPLLGNGPLVDWVFRKNLRSLKNAEGIQRVLVISDIHIGDSIFALGAVMAFRDFFPEARIDFLVKRSVGAFFEGNPDITTLYPLFTGAQFPNEEDLEIVQKLVAENRYDLCFNCCLFFDETQLFRKGQTFLSIATAAPPILKNLRDRTGTCHFMYQSYDLPYRLLSRSMTPARKAPFRGAPVTISDHAIAEAEGFLRDAKVPLDKQLVLMNTDAACRFNLVPIDKQVELLGYLLETDAHILLGPGITSEGIEKRVLEQFSDTEKPRFTIVPASIYLDAYCALMDRADVFISADTGPLHLGAARKVSRSGSHQFRNRTFVASVFGATNARMSGYDSADPLFPPADQDAPSRCYVSESPCRNITCMNKMAKTCKVVRCFEVLDVRKAADDIKEYLAGRLVK